MCLDNLEQIQGHLKEMLAIRAELKKLDDAPADADALRKISNTEYAMLLYLRLSQAQTEAAKLGVTFDEKDLTNAEDKETGRLLETGEVAGDAARHSAEESAGVES